MAHGGDWKDFQIKYGRQPLDFSANISPLGLPQGVRDAAAHALEYADRYPDPQCRDLRNALSQTLEIPLDRIVCGNGAADLIYRLCQVIRPKRAMLPEPEFAEYRRALLNSGASIQTWPLFTGKASAQTRKITLPQDLEEGTDVLFLSNPNNPTGLLAEREELEKLLRVCREKRALLVLDECFLDFAEQPERASMQQMILDWPELVVLKAFTKTYAMAGLRLGYALCGSAELAKKLQEEGQPWSVSLVAQEAGIAAVQEEDYVSELRRLTSRERRRMRDALTALGLEVLPGAANYLLFYCEEFALREKLSHNGILIRDCADYAGLGPGWYRVAVRTEEENGCLLAEMKEVL